MKTRSTTLCLGLLVLVGTDQLTAQMEPRQPPSTLADLRIDYAVKRRPTGEIDIGTIIDRIHKLSGPAFNGLGLTVAHAPRTWNDIALRFTIAHRWSENNDKVTPADANIRMVTLQPSVEFPLTRRAQIDGGVGIALHNFVGDIESFWHYSVPLHLQYRFRPMGVFVPRIGAGVHLFPPFGDDDFEPLVVDVSLEDWEIGPYIFVGLDFRVKSGVPR